MHTYSDRGQKKFQKTSRIPAKGRHTTGLKIQPRYNQKTINNTE